MACGCAIWSTIREPALAADAITTALDVQRHQGRSALESLVEVLQGRQLLVVFDNCEHLLAPIGEVDRDRPADVPWRANPRHQPRTAGGGR